MGIKVTVRGPMFQPGLAEKVSREEMADGIDEAAGRLRDGIAAEARKHRATGAMDSGVKVVDRAKGAAVTTSKPYGIPLDSGTKPGFFSKRGAGNVALWAQQKLGLDAKEAKRAAWAISKDHGRHGTPPLHFFYRTFDRMQPGLAAALGAVPGQIVGKLS